MKKWFTIPAKFKDFFFGWVVQILIVYMGVLTVLALVTFTIRLYVVVARLVWGLL
jgi:hypothetical protein